MQRHLWHRELLLPDTAAIPGTGSYCSQIRPPSPELGAIAPKYDRHPLNRELLLLNNIHSFISEQLSPLYTVQPDTTCIKPTLLKQLFIIDLVRINTLLLRMTRTNTKEKIIATALSLFNRDGAGKTTTNHIAAAAGISPGNLYYHFKNKDEIVRLIFQSMTVEFASVWKNFDPNKPLLDEFKKVFREMAPLYSRYRFFYLEINPLLNNDPLLGELYKKNLNSRKQQQMTLFSNTSLLQEGQPLESYMTAAWIISDFWLSYLNITGSELTEENIAGAFPVLETVLTPILSKKLQ